MKERKILTAAMNAAMAVALCICCHAASGRPQIGATAASSVPSDSEIAALTPKINELTARRIRSIPTSRGTSTSIRATSAGTTTTAATSGGPCVLCEDLPNSARTARVFDSF